MDFSEYNLVYLNVKCTGVDWTNRPYPLFKFSYRDKDFIFMQIHYVSQSADTDHIRVVIEYQFIPFLLAQNKDLELEKYKIALNKVIKDRNVLAENFYCMAEDNGQLYEDYYLGWVEHEMQEKRKGG